MSGSEDFCFSEKALKYNVNYSTISGRVCASSETEERLHTAMKVLKATHLFR